MGCNCKTTDSILALVVIVFALWPALIVSATVGKWILVIAGVLLLIHANKCGNMCDMPAPKKAASKKKRR